MATSQVPFSYDVLLQTISRPIYQGQPSKTVVITSIHINNYVSEDYNIEFLLITPTHNTKGLLYSVKLFAGHFLVDDTEYRLAPNAELWAKSDKTTTNVVINGYSETVIP